MLQAQQDGIHGPHTRSRRTLSRPRKDPSMHPWPVMPHRRTRSPKAHQSNHLPFQIPTTTQHCMWTDNNAVLDWLPQHENAFAKIKELITQAPVFPHFYVDKEVTVECDSSYVGLLFSQQGFIIGMIQSEIRRIHYWQSWHFNCGYRNCALSNF